MSTELLIVIFNLMLFIHNIFYLELVNNIFDWQSKKIKILIFGLANCTSGTGLLVLFGSMSSLGYGIMLVFYSIMVLIYCSGQKNIVKTMVAACILTFNLQIMCVRGIIAAIASYITGTSIIELSRNTTTFWVILMLTSVFITILSIAVIVVMPKKYVRALAQRTEFTFFYFTITVLGNIYMITNGMVYIIDIDFEPLPFHQLIASSTWLIAMYASMFMMFISDVLRQRKEKLENKLAKDAVYKQALMQHTDTILEINCTNNKLLKIIQNSEEEKEEPTVSYSQYYKSFCSDFVNKEDREKMLNHSKLSNIIDNFNNGIQRISCIYRMLQEDGTYKWVKDTITIRQEEVNNYIIAIKTITDDIHDMKLSEEKLIHDTQKDYLVGAYNRKTTESLIRHHLAEGEEAVMFLLDLDNFKAVNDNMGHSYGDNVLKEFYEAIAKSCRRDDIIGRLGGDEFIVFFRNGSSAENISLKAERICKAANRTYTTERASVTISCSIGIALSPRDGITYEELYNASDIAMYSCKNSGKNGFAFYSLDMNSEES